MAVTSVVPLKDYPRPAFNTRSGMHGSADKDFPFGPDPQKTIGYLADHGFSWITILMNPNGDNKGLVDYALSRGMGVVVRFYRERPNPGVLTEEQKNTLRAWANEYRGKPVYIVYNNESDIKDEWQHDVLPENWMEIVARTSIEDCRFIQGIGMIPVLVAPATGSPNFYNWKLIPKMLELGGEDIFSKKVVFGVHDYPRNHPVGDLPFEDQPYPYDAVNQVGRALAPGEFEAYGDVWQAWNTGSAAEVNARRAGSKNPGQNVMNYGAALSSLAYEHLYSLNIKGILPGPIPVMATEGWMMFGAFDDHRYPRVNTELRIARQWVLSRRLWNDPAVSNHYPAYYFCSAPWMAFDRGPWPHDGWFKDNGDPKDEFVGFFQQHKAGAKNMNPLIEAAQGGDGATKPTPPSAGLEQAAWAAVDAPGVRFAIPPQHFALPSAVTRHSQRAGGNGKEFQINTPEIRFQHGGVWWAAMAAIRLVDRGEFVLVYPHGNYAATAERIFYRNYKPAASPTQPAQGYAIKNVNFITPNQHARPAGTKIGGVVWHHTGGGANALQATFSHFANPESEASAHYIIDRDGTIYRALAEHLASWHVGKSRAPDGREWLNDWTIGIELVNAGDGKEPFTAKLVAAAEWLGRDISRRYGLDRNDHFKHGDVRTAWNNAHPNDKGNWRGDPAANLDFAKLVSNIFAVA